MEPQRVQRPLPVIFIALFQFSKAAFLLIVAAFLWLSPESLPHSGAFSQVLFIAAHGKDLSGVLVPLFACYVAYVGWGLLRLRPSIRRTLAVSSAITIAVSLNRLGVFGESSVTNDFQREALYMLILLDLAVYIYLVFHPEIARSFKGT
jgi:hypothetical protein